MKPPVLTTAFALFLVACSGTQGREADDAFFRLPIVRQSSEHPAPPPPAPATRPEPRALRPAQSGAGAYRVALTVHRPDGAAITVPPITVASGQSASVYLADQFAYIEDFDLEIAASAHIADPVVGMIVTGIQAEMVATPIPGTDRIALSFAFEQSGLDNPVRARSIPLAPGTEPVTIQFPSTPVTRFEGRTRISPGEDTVLAVMPLAPEFGPGSTRVTVRVDPVPCEPPLVGSPLPGSGPEPDLSVFLGSEPAAVTPPRLLSPVDPDALPPSDGTLEISVVEIPRALDAPSLHLSADEAQVRLADLRLVELKGFRVRSGAEPGMKVSCLLKKSYLRDYHLENETDGPPVDPQVDRFTVGFTADIVDRGVIPALGWTFSTYFLIEDFLSSVHGTELVLPREIPLITRKAGALALLDDVNLMEIAPLDDGRRIALLVRRIGR